MDRGGWWAIVRRIIMSWTPLSDWPHTCPCFQKLVKSRRRTQKLTGQGEKGCEEQEHQRGNLQSPRCLMMGLWTRQQGCRVCFISVLVPGKDISLCLNALRKRVSVHVIEGHWQTRNLRRGWWENRVIKMVNKQTETGEVSQGRKRYKEGRSIHGPQGWWQRWGVKQRTPRTLWQIVALLPWKTHKLLGPHSLISYSGTGFFCCCYVAQSCPTIC